MLAQLIVLLHAPLLLAADPGGDKEPTDAAAPALEMTVESSVFETIRNPDIDSARDEREVCHVTFRVQNTGRQAAWIHWADPTYLRGSRFQLHAAESPFRGCRFSGIELRKVDAGKLIRIEARFPILQSWSRYDVQFAVAAELPEEAADKIRHPATVERTSDLEWPCQKQQELDSRVARHFKPVNLTFNLPERRPPLVQIMIRSQKPVGKERFKKSDGKEYYLPKYFRCTYRIRNQSNQPAIVLVGDDSLSHHYVERQTLCWSDRIICIRRIPVIRFIEVPPGSDREVSFRFPPHSEVMNVYCATDLSPAELKQLRTYDGAIARPDARSWVINHTRPIYVAHSLGIKPTPYLPAP